MKKLFTILLCICMLSCLSSYSQIRYLANGKLLIGNVSVPAMSNDLTCTFNGIYMRPSANKYFGIDLHTYSSAPTLYCSGSTLMFKDPHTNGYLSLIASHLQVTSDLTLKTNINDFQSGLDVVSQLRPVSYNYINEPTGRSVPSEYMGTNTEVGLIAQELEEVLPALVYTDSDGIKYIDYIALIPVLIDAIQSLQAEVEQLKAQ